MRTIKIIATILFIMPTANVVLAQAPTLTLEQAYEKALQNYPLIKQRELVKQTAQLNIDNLQAGYMPQINLTGQASYQTDVTKVSIPLPGISITPPSKDQYKIVVDASQLLYDGGVIKEQQNLQKTNADVEVQKTEVELYKLRDRINQLFLGSLLIDEQLKQVLLVDKDIETGIKRVEAQVKNGIAFKSNLNSLKAELLKNQQRKIELLATKKSLLTILGQFLHQELAQDVVLLIPSPNVLSSDHITRPELKLIEGQKQYLLSQEKIITARNKPRASIFFQGGYGRPGLNMLKNDFALYGIGGLRLNWNLSTLYTFKRDKQVLDVLAKNLDVQKETFLLNTQTQLTQQKFEISRWAQLIETDKEIIALRSSIKDAAKAQLENGVITSSDYIREVNAEDQSRQALITHQVQWLQAQINYKTILGN